MKRVYLVRHGETDGNLKQYSQLPDTELTDAGHRGAEALAKRFATLDVDLLVASPYKRAQQTAQYVSDVCDKPIVTVESFHENIRPEAVRGKVYDDQSMGIYRQYFEDLWTENRRLSGMEHFSDIKVRIKTSIDFLVGRQEDDILVVSHGDFLRMLISYALLIPTDDDVAHEALFDSLKRIDNVGISVLEYEKEHWKLSMYNDHSHFAEN